MRQWRTAIGDAGNLLVLMESVASLADPEAYAAAYARLPRFRREKADSLLFERDRWLSVGAWNLLDRAFMLEGFCLDDYRIGYSQRGKPYPFGCPLSFNISHSGEYVMCAVTPAGEAGCDIQRIDAYDAGLARTCMMPCEIEEVEALPSASQRAHAFCRHWVAKESYLKALGCGLAKPPSSFAIAFRDGGEWDLESDSSGAFRILDDALTGRLEAFEVHAPEGYCAAVCVLDCSCESLR